MNPLTHHKKATGLFSPTLSLRCGQQERQNPPMKTNTLSWILVSLLTGFAFLQPAHSAKNVTAYGDGALESNQGDNNTAFGHSPLRFNIFGKQNTATGAFALNNTDLGNSNTATGFQAMLESSTGNRNTATGQSALQNNSTLGNDNTATGVNALFRNTHGYNNTATGSGALFNNTTGIRNMPAGFQALQQNTTGERNTAVGFSSLDKNTTGSFNVALGAGAGSNVISANDVICIGRDVNGANVSGTCFIGNIRGVTTQNANALPV